MSASLRRRSCSPGHGPRKRSRSRSPKPSPKAYNSSPLASGQLELFAELSARRRAKAAAEQEKETAAALSRARKARAKEIVDEFCHLNPGSRRGLGAYAASHLVGSTLSDEEMYARLQRVRQNEADRAEERDAAKQHALKKKDEKATKRVQELFGHESQHAQLSKLGKLFDKRVFAVLKWVSDQLIKLVAAGCLVKARPCGPVDDMFKPDELGSRVARSLSQPNVAWERIHKVLLSGGSKLRDANAVHVNFLTDLSTVLVSHAQAGEAKCEALKLGQRPSAIGELCDISDECAARMIQAARMQAVNDLLRRSIHSKSKTPDLLQRYLASKQDTESRGRALEASSVLKRLN